MTNRFYHGGHIGDCIYALYTIMKMGGGEVYIGPHDHGAWGPDERNALLPLVRFQPYVSKAEIVFKKPEDLTYDFTRTWSDLDPWLFWEWHEKSNPGNINLKKRDLVNCMLRNGYSLAQILEIIDHSESWLTVPRRENAWVEFDVVVHAPLHKMTRSYHEYKDILVQLKNLTCARIAIIGGNDVDLWEHSDFWMISKPSNLLVAASMINHAKLFMGTASCCYVIAEALNKFRLVDIFQPAEGTVPMNEKGWDTSGWDSRKILRAAKDILDG